MPTRVLYDQGQDKPAGVENVYQEFTQFMFQTNWELAPTGAGQQDIRDAIDELWDALTAGIAATIQGSVTGTLTVADEEQMLVIATMVASETLRQYRTQLPSGAGGGGP